MSHRHSHKSSSPQSFSAKETYDYWPFCRKRPVIKGILCMMHATSDMHPTGWRRYIGCLKLQVSFRKRATNYRAFLREIICEDKASHVSLPPCSHVCVWWISLHMHIMNISPYAHHEYLSMCTPSISSSLHVKNVIEICITHVHMWYSIHHTSPYAHGWCIFPSRFTKIK